MKKDENIQNVGPLKGLRVLDLTSYLSGPFCTMILGDMGAEIIKIERPPKGDEMRPWPPLINGLGSYFVMVNRNKKSLTLNIVKETGMNILRQLIKTADVLVENSRPGVMERLGLSPEIVFELNERIIFCRISGFGQTGPYARFPGYDQILQGMGGLMSVTGTEESGPIRSGVAIGDILTAIFGANGIMAALLAREHTNKGQVVSTSLLESVVAALTVQAGVFLATGQAPPPAGNEHPVVSPYGLFRVKDGYLNIAAATDAMFNKMCSVIGRPELASREEYATNAKRVENRNDLKQELEKALIAETRASWEVKLRDAQVPCGSVLRVDEVFSNPQVLHTDMLVKIAHPEMGLFKLPGIPVKLNQTPGTIRSAPPKLGEHTEEIIQEIGFSTEEIKSLYAGGIL
jgi:crotonobetainyl-CoA:carnitine CoA-transferase CaiB-like acyl-CoA transferase